MHCVQMYVLLPWWYQAALASHHARFWTIPYMSTLRHSYGVSVILASLKTSVPETKISVIWRSPRNKKKVRIFWQSIVKTPANFRAFSTFCFSAGISYSIAMAKRFLNSICCNISSSVFPPLSVILSQWLNVCWTPSVVTSHPASFLHY